MSVVDPRVVRALGGVPRDEARGGDSPRTENVLRTPRIPPETCITIR